MSSWWRYQGQCLGRVLHFLYHYVGFDAAEHAVVGDGVVDLHGQRLATFTWSTRFGERDVPEFVFTGERASTYEAGQCAKRKVAIDDALPCAPEMAARKAVDVDVLYAVNPCMARALQLWTCVTDAGEPVWFVANRVLWCKTARSMYYWNRELGAWLRGPVDDFSEEVTAV